MAKIKKKLLIVEDDHSISNLLKLMFIGEGLPPSDIDIASNGEVALQLIGRFDYSAISTDLQMPICDGYMFLFKLDKSLYPKVIVFSAFVDSRLDEYKGITVFDKPSDGQQLLEKVKELCQPQVNV